MRLISCHIENFGRFSDFDLDFSEGLNVICRENGWGKSTLAAFIKAMLYGFDGERKRDLDENERKRYKPWQGGVFGGRLDFEAGGKRYSVTRSFGDSASKDSFELRDAATNLPCGDFSERLGEDLFRLNSASFYRSIFIGQNDCPTVSTDDIHAKIGNLADNTADMNSFEAAEGRLAKQINRLSPSRATGVISVLSSETAALRRRVAEGSRLDAMIAENEEEASRVQRERSALLETKAELERRQKQAIRQHRLFRQRSEWERLKKAAADAGNALDAAVSAFPGGVPQEETVRESLHRAVEMKSAECLMTSYALTEQEARRLAALRERFGDQPPAQEALEGYLGDEQALRRITEAYERLRLTSDERSRLDSLMEAFSGDEASPSEVAEKWNERCGRQRALSAKRNAHAALEASYRSARAAAGRRTVLLIAAGLLLIGAGIALLYLFSEVWYLCASVLGGLLVAGGILSSVLSHMSQPPDEMRRLSSDIGNDEGVIELIGHETAQYLLAHGRAYDEQFVPTMLQELCGDRRDLDMLAAKAETAEKYISGSRFAELNEGLRNTLARYGVAPDDSRLSDQLYELKESASEYERLREREAKHAEAGRHYEQIRRSLGAFIASAGYGAPDDVQEALQRIRDDVAECGRLRRQQAAAAAALRCFEEGCDLAALEMCSGESLPSLESIAEELSECTRSLEGLGESLHSLRQTGEELYKAFAQWESDRDALREKSDRLESERLKFERLKKAKELLRRAKESMTARYIAPVTSGFSRYYALLAEAPPDSYRIDADIRVTVEALGRQREVEALSTGYRDLTGVCLRLALTDAMFRQEKPPLIMDDPFNNLDDSKAAASKRLLADVAKRYQLIYFTCSASRAAE